MAYKRKTNRPYNKTSDHWKKFEKNKSQPEGEGTISVSTASFEEPESFGSPINANPSIYEARARSTAVSGTRTSYRRNRATTENKKDRFSIIRQSMSPWEESGDMLSIRDTVSLCQKAYSNFALFRNVIDMMAEFSNSEIYLEGGSKKSRTFFEGWLRGINIWKLTDQFFREYFRGGNIFMLRVDGRVSASKFRTLKAAYGAAVIKVPVKYTLLNPADIVAKNNLFYDRHGYCKLLSKYDIERLKNPITEEDKIIFKALPEKARSQIANKQYLDTGIEVELPTDKMYFIFYKKQDYEPFATPFGFPVLEDINAKQELKNLDNAIMRTIENAILLITTGAEEDKGGVNQHNLRALKNLFRNEGVGRVLVADYTTKAEFIIPDLQRVVGPAKYEILNKDIKEGLQNIVLSDDRQSTAEVKAKIFLDRLREARQAFVYEFLQPEIRRIAKDVGLRNWPQAKFKDIDFRDDIQLMRIGLRLIELGVMTPEQGMKFMDTGRFPDPDTLDEGQEDFVKKREKGYYNPIVGGVPETPPPIDPNNQLRQQNKTPQQRGRPLGSQTVQQKAAASEKPASIANIKKVVYDIESLREKTSEDLKKKHKLKTLSAGQEEFLDKMCESIVIAKEKKEWSNVAKECVKESANMLKLNIPLEGVVNLASEHGLEDYPAAILYHSYNER